MKATLTSACIAFCLLLVGCSGQHGQHTTDKTTLAEDQAARIKEARAKLSAEDRVLVEEQEYCAIQTGEHLGAMGTPYKVMVKERPVFLCCKSCEKKALADADKTLAKVDELKAAAKAKKTP